MRNATLTGLKQLEPDCKCQVFCKNDQKRSIATVSSSYLMVSCSTTASSVRDGIIYPYTGRTGYEVVCIVDRTEDDTKLKVRSVTLLSLWRTDAILEGAGDPRLKVVNFASKLFS